MISDSHQNLSHEKSIELEFFRESPIVKSLTIRCQGFFSSFCIICWYFWVWVAFVCILGGGGGLDAGSASLVSQTVHDT